MKAQERRGLQDNRGTDQPARAHEERTDASDNTIGKTEIRRPFSRPIEDDQLLLEQHRFGDHRTGAAGTGKSGNCREQVENKDGEVAHAIILPISYRAEIPVVQQLAIHTVFVIDLASRRVRILGSTPHPEASFMQQIVRTLTMAETGGVDTLALLICDRDRKWSGDVRRRLQEAGIRVVLIPERAPNANAYAERFVRSIKEECLDRIVPIGERHFRRAIAAYVDHYHRERNHQGLDNRLIAGTPVIDQAGRVRRRPRLGGLLNYYERAS
jgi:hypothetical protein